MSFSAQGDSNLQGISPNISINQTNTYLSEQVQNNTNNLNDKNVVNQPKSSQTVQDPLNRRENWSTHLAPDGREYYYNSVTNTSTFDKPDCLKSEEERALKCDWKEYLADGKKYWYNHITNQSVWDKPAEYQDYENKLKAILEREKQKEMSNKNIENSNNVDSNNNNNINENVLIPQTISTTTTTTNIKIVNTIPTSSNNINSTITPKSKVPVYKSESDAKQVFFDLLDESKVTSKTPWAEIVKIVSNDIRWQSLSTVGQRKQAWSEWVNKAAKREEEEARLRYEKSIDDYNELLKRTTEITSDSTWGEVKVILEHCPEYSALNNEKKRRDLYFDYIHELEKKEREERRQRKNTNIAALKEILKTKTYTSRTKYDKIKEDLRDEKCWIDLDRDDKHKIYSDYIKSKIDEEKAIQKQIITECEEELTKAIFKLIDEVKICSSTRWKDIKSTISQYPFYKKLKSIDVSCHDLYDNILRKYKRILRDPLDIISKFIKEKEIVFTEDLTYDFISNSINESAEEGEKIKEMNNKDNTMLKRSFYELLYVYRYEKEKDRKKFFSLLKEYYYKEKHLGTTYDQAKEKLAGKSDWERIMSPEERQELFNDYMTKLEKKIKSKKEEENKEDKKDDSKVMEEEEKKEEENNVNDDDTKTETEEAIKRKLEDSDDAEKVVKKVETDVNAQ